MLSGGDDDIYFQVFDAGDEPSGWTFTVGGNVTEEDETVLVQDAADEHESPMFRTSEIALSIGVHFPKTDLPDIVGRLRAVAAEALL